MRRSRISQFESSTFDTLLTLVDRIWTGRSWPFTDVNPPILKELGHAVRSNSPQSAS